MVITLEEMKSYLRVDFDDDDVLLRNIMESAQTLCMDVAELRTRMHLRKSLVPELQSCMQLLICMSTGKMQTIMH